MSGKVQCMCRILNTIRDSYPHLYRQFLFTILTNSSTSMISRYQNARLLVHFQGYWERNALKEMLYATPVKTKPWKQHLYQISVHQIWMLLLPISERILCLRLHFVWLLTTLIIDIFLSLLWLPKNNVFHFFTFSDLSV